MSRLPLPLRGAATTDTQSQSSNLRSQTAKPTHVPRTRVDPDNPGRFFGNGDAKGMIIVVRRAIRRAWRHERGRACPACDSGLPTANSAPARPPPRPAPLRRGGGRKNIGAAAFFFETISASWRLCVRLSFEGASISRMKSTYMDSVGCVERSIRLRILVVGLNEEGSHAEARRRGGAEKSKEMNEEEEVELEDVGRARTCARRFLLT